MLTFLSNDRDRNCEGTTRRNFLRVGALGLGSLTLPDLLRARAAAKQSGKPTNDKSVIWLWLSGGPTHIETFDPNMTAPAEYRSMTGEVPTPLTGVTVGGTFPQIGKVVDRMALVRSFAHTNSGHGGGTHYVMTGYNDRNIDNGGLPRRPSIGSIVARYRGANHPVSGIPTFVRQRSIRADGPAFLGSAYAPFDSGGQARKNMRLTIDQARFEQRRTLLASIDDLNRQVDRSGLMAGMDAFEQQASSLVLGSAYEAFDYKHEDPKTIERYGRGLGEQLLTARRLCEAGCGFVTINYGGWDMHGNLHRSITSRSDQMDRGVSALIEDLHQRGLDDKVLLVITGEFGRTPKVNKNAGRDHWAPLSTLALAGGGLRMGQVVGDSAPKGDVPGTTPIGPQDLMATMFHVLDIPSDLQYTNEAGRPVYMLEEGKPISELI